MTEGSTAGVRLGPILFAAGIVVAIAGGAKLPAEQGGWPETWPASLVGAVVSAVGIGLWRRDKAAQREATANGETGNGSNPFHFLRESIAPMQALGSEIGELDCESICERVDAVLESFILPLAEVRERIVDRLGMDKGAELLVVVAYGERILNRVWSAAADGHLPEARSCFTEALEAFEEAQKMAQKALA